MEKKEKALSTNLSQNEQKIYNIIHEDCLFHVFCFSYISDLSRRSKIDGQQVCRILRRLEEVGYIRTFCQRSPFCRRITIEAEEISNEQNFVKLKYIKSKDKDIIEKLIETREITTIYLWTYLKTISVLKKKKITTLKEICDEIAISQEGKHNWINSLYLKNLLTSYEALGFSQWEAL